MTDTAHHTDVVVAGIDGSLASRLALAWAADEADQRGWHLHVLTAWQSPPPSTDPSTEGEDAPPSTLSEPDDAAREATEMVDREVQAVLGEEATVARRAEPGRPAEVLIEATRHARLLVIAAPGHGVHDRWYGVAEQVARNARCAVLMVPGPDAPRAGAR
ncbi:universal stress protein [Actinomycetospora cinnamomea]|uniref:Nucleotide-binding universal stress UspA family protein n=1 Tax=Actinomycetospora cinnamomea TaxID=663609 RepID=A0A2U1F3V0_9PSEU|nr:universal stress protein [Actinomycetospora cinnamomea]PVZ06847.1 nucleotide-binding universal stress UspA family protein [Actinomycetospora cinnamomea]